MAAREKTRDELDMQTLRELASLPANKFCFDCGQRGTTYVNVTIGAFVCSACGGLLRGLNPPHRVKSLTVCSFTEVEMDRIKSRGNENNSTVPGQSTNAPQTNTKNPFL
ncbi:unnamed protein product [Larinioides sclopetarius]|uniref:Arf-GAP domain-containing protein n=1 Tax=Larinioides sclopetarius TaxID=280406 RepID=A0AAV2BKG8_9ARAC